MLFRSVPLKPTFDPQNLTVSGAGRALDMSPHGANNINARLSIGDAVALTSLDVKMQAAPDDGTGSPGSWADIPGAAFTQVTTDPGTNGLVDQIITFKMPPPLTLSSSPYIWLRAYATLVGTSILICVTIFASRRYDGNACNNNAPGNNNNIIN